MKLQALAELELVAEFQATAMVIDAGGELRRDDPLPAQPEVLA
jgi:hypothetical protein